MKIAVAILVALGIFFGGYGAGVEKGFTDGMKQGKEEACNRVREYLESRFKTGQGRKE